MNPQLPLPTRPRFGRTLALALALASATTLAGVVTGAGVASADNSFVIDTPTYTYGQQFQAHGHCDAPHTFVADVIVPSYIGATAAVQPDGSWLFKMSPGYNGYPPPGSYQLTIVCRATDGATTEVGTQPFTVLPDGATHSFVLDTPAIAPGESIRAHGTCVAPYTASAQVRLAKQGTIDVPVAADGSWSVEVPASTEGYPTEGWAVLVARCRNGADQLSLAGQGRVDMVIATTTTAPPSTMPAAESVPPAESAPPVDPTATAPSAPAESVVIVVQPANTASSGIASAAALPETGTNATTAVLAVAVLALGLLCSIATRRRPSRRDVAPSAR